MKLVEIKENPNIKLPKYKGFKLSVSYPNHPLLGLDIKLEKPDKNNLFEFHVSLGIHDKQFNAYMIKTSYYTSSVYSKHFYVENTVEDVMNWIKEILLDFYNVCKIVQPERLSEEDTQRYYIEANYGHGDSGEVERDLTKKQALKLFNDLIGGDFRIFQQAYDYDHPIYSIYKH